MGWGESTDPAAAIASTDLPFTEQEYRLLKEIKEKKEEYEKTRDDAQKERLEKEIVELRKNLAKNREVNQHNQEIRKMLEQQGTSAEGYESGSGENIEAVIRRQIREVPTSPSEAPAASAAPEPITDGLANLKEGWVPARGRTVGGEPAYFNGKETIAENKGDPGTVLHQRAGESGYTVKPKEMFQKTPEGQTPATKVVSGDKTAEMTGKTLNTGNRSVPEYKLPDGSTGFFDEKGKWMQKTAGNDYFTKADKIPDGFKAGDNGRLVAKNTEPTPNSTEPILKDRVSAPSSPGHAQPTDLIHVTAATGVLNYGQKAPVGSTLTRSGQTYEVVANRVGSIDLGNGTLRPFNGGDAALIVKNGEKFYWANGTYRGELNLVEVKNNNGQWTVK